MKELQVEDPVYFLHATQLHPGKVVRINKKSITVRYSMYGSPIKFDKLVKEDRIAHARDNFTVVWEVNAGPMGRYYITDTEFPDENGPACKWHQPYTYYVYG